MAVSVYTIIAEITEKPVWDAIRAVSLVYFNRGKTEVDVRGINDKIRVVVVAKVKKYIALQFRKTSRNADKEVVN